MKLQEIGDLVLFNSVCFLERSGFNTWLTQVRLSLMTEWCSEVVGAAFVSARFPQRNFGKQKTARRTQGGHSDGCVVAGTGLEPVTFGL